MFKGFFLYFSFLLPFFFSSLSATHLSPDEVTFAADCAHAVYNDAEAPGARVAQHRYVFGRPRQHLMDVLLRANPQYHCGEIYHDRAGKRFATFRGTVGIDEWLKDARADLVNHHLRGANIGRVHQGFLAHTNSFYQEFLTELQRSGYQWGDPLVLVGHSLGAASTLVAASLLISDPNFHPQTDLSVVLFSCPRVGDQNFVTFINNRIPRNKILHFYCAQDIVPGVPLNGQTSPLVGDVAQRLGNTPGIRGNLGHLFHIDYRDIQAISIPISFLEASYEKLNITRAVVWGAAGMFAGPLGKLALLGLGANLLSTIVVTNHMCHPNIICDAYGDYIESSEHMSDEDFQNKSLFFSSERNPVFRFFA